MFVMEENPVSEEPRKAYTREQRDWLVFFNKLPDEQQPYVDYLHGEKKVSFETVKQYLIYFRAWLKGGYTLDFKSARSYLSDFTGNSARAFLKSYCKFNKIEPLVEDPTGKAERKQGEVLTEEEYERMRPFLYKKHVKFGLLGDIQFYGAARRSEGLKLRANDLLIDEWNEGEKLRIKVSAKKAGRKILIPADTAERLLNYIANLVSKNVIRLDENPVILQQLGKSAWASTLKEASIRFLGYNAVERIGHDGKTFLQKVPKRIVSSHTLRRSRATIWHRQGIPVEKIQRRLGHANLNTTMVYIKMDDEDLLSEWAGEED